MTACELLTLSIMTDDPGASLALPGGVERSTHPTNRKPVAGWRRVVAKLAGEQLAAPTSPRRRRCSNDSSKVCFSGTDSDLALIRSFTSSPTGVNSHSYTSIVSDLSFRNHRQIVSRGDVVSREDRLDRLTVTSFFEAGLRNQERGTPTHDR